MNIEISNTNQTSEQENEIKKNNNKWFQLLLWLVKLKIFGAPYLIMISEFP